MGERYSAGQRDGAYVLTDRETRAEARIVPPWGNNATHFRVAPPGRRVDEPIDVLLPPADAADLGPGGYGAGNPILFPFPNRVRGGTYTFEGRSYRLDLNEPGRGNHIHGLVGRLGWTVEAAGASDDAGAWQRASLRLDEHPEVARQYPFPCRLAVTSRLQEGVLIQDAAVTNTGPTRLPMGYGTHPWFPATLLGGRRSGTEVRVPGSRNWELVDLVPTGRTVAVDEPAGRAGKYDLRRWRALGEDEYDDVYTDLIRRPDGWSEAGIRYPNLGLELVVEAGPEFREWVIYAPAARPVVCLESYTGTTNAVNLQAQGIDAGLVVLEPGATWRGTIRTSLRSSEE
jgi:aldose 1-epimerase